MKVTENLFKSTPQQYENGIPIFSERDAYIKNYERIANDHLTHLKKTGKNPWINEDLWNEMEDTTLKQINKYLKKGDKILDVGVGTGRLLGKITTDVEKYGFDISMENLAISSEKGINCCFAKIEDMPYKNETFDIVVATDVLEHVMDLNFCVNKILQTLKRSQYFIIRVPYKEELKGYNMPEYPYEFVHLRTFEEWGVKLFFEKIMKCKLIEYELTGTWLVDERLKWGVKMPRDSKALRISNYLTKGFRKRIKDKNPEYYKTMFWPLEISCVIQKV